MALLIAAISAQSCRQPPTITLPPQIALNFEISWRPTLLNIKGRSGNGRLLWSTRAGAWARTNHAPPWLTYLEHPIDQTRATTTQIAEVSSSSTSPVAPTRANQTLDDQRDAIANVISPTENQQSTRGQEPAIVDVTDEESQSPSNQVEAIEEIFPSDPFVRPYTGSIPFGPEPSPETISVINSSDRAFALRYWQAPGVWNFDQCIALIREETRRREERNHIINRPRSRRGISSIYVRSRYGRPLLACLSCHPRPLSRRCLPAARPPALFTITTTRPARFQETEFWETIDR